MFEFVGYSKNDVRARSMFDKMVFDPSLSATVGINSATYLGWRPIWNFYNHRWITLEEVKRGLFFKKGPPHFITFQISPPLLKTFCELQRDFVHAWVHLLMMAEEAIRCSNAASVCPFVARWVTVWKYSPECGIARMLWREKVSCWGRDCCCSLISWKTSVEPCTL